MTNKHEEHKCEDCGKTLPTSFELILHSTKHHGKMCKICGKQFKTSMNLRSHEDIEHNKEDELLNEILQSTPKLDKEKTNSSFVFNEAMLDEFL